MLRLSKEIGLEGLRTHDLRRTCATWLGNLDVPDEIIERVLNRAPRTITRKHYNHASQLESMRIALERWSDRLRRIVGTVNPYLVVDELLPTDTKTAELQRVP